MLHDLLQQPILTKVTKTHTMFLILFLLLHMIMILIKKMYDNNRYN